MSTAVLLIGVFLVSVALNALFAGYETGFVASNLIRMRHLAEKENHTNAKRLLAYRDQPESMLTVVLLGTNIALVMGTIAITRQVGGMWATIIAIPIFLIFGEIVPKSMFRIHPTRLALGFLPVIRFFHVLLTPFVVPITWLSKQLIATGPGAKRDIRSLMRSQEDVRVLVDESADQGAIEPEEQEMIHSVMDLQTSQAKEVMLPRIDVQALPDTAKRAELIALLKESGHTRIPIYRESIDQIVGVVNAFDVLTDENPKSEEIRRFVKDIIHVPDTMKLDDVLKTMRDMKNPMAVVTDEYGGTDGIITIEDILEEIFGEIHDEFDKKETTIRKVGPNAYVIDARLPLEDAAEVMGLAITDEEVETVGGWLMHAIGRIPEQGEEILHGRFRITVLDGGPNYVASIRLEVLPEVEQHHDG